MRAFDYHLCDVFTDTPFHGNQLAVFENAGDLTQEEMQKIAKETNLSETTFIVRRSPEMEKLRGVRVRIFTTQEELPFAGHPTLGTSTFIRQHLPEYADCESIELELNVGPVSVRFSPPLNGAVHGEMTQPDPIFGQLHDHIEVARAIGVKADDLAMEMPVQTVSTGLPYCIVPFRAVDALSQLRIPAAAAEEYLSDKDAKFFYCIAPELKGIWRARMQFYNGEDPATGSAAGCAISYLVHHGFAASDEQLHIRQGIEMGRPSMIDVRAKFDGVSVREVRVGGSTVFVAKGRFFLE
ncbi:PhzF family phenazine biosynthesis protein [Alloacidobacterium dinghuense]|uniref:PhzF family phenazine biosynthesis protein n=1 Tax=Alloacidobacterium dinghuense TaxID=2763107 RepID=A0A7G8BF41_9BACT|nr:PhzF family phenazine biosynthesis protein [Alloacidobacterium dinghuense]QNI31161.1 PhzF family phenazine biosynthesis protein [Alloacidobacterium dinghuense]